jgi:hypothetical protein
MVQAIVDDLERRGWQQTTGEVLHVFLIRALAEGGRGDILHRIYSRDGVGSYSHMVRLGLTTLPESWEAKPGTGNSMNHFMLGHLMEWHFAYVAGLRQQPPSIGWRQVMIAPQPGDLDSASAVLDAPSGRFVIGWTRTGDRFTLTGVIPTGVEGGAILPDGSQYPLREGKNTFSCALNR